MFKVRLKIPKGGMGRLAEQTFVITARDKDAAKRMAKRKHGGRLLKVWEVNPSDVKWWET